MNMPKPSVPKTVGQPAEKKVFTNDVKLGKDSMKAVTPSGAVGMKSVEEQLASPVTSESVLVVATAKGYYGDLRRNVGDQFYISSKEHFSENWMSMI